MRTLIAILTVSLFLMNSAQGQTGAVQRSVSPIKIPQRITGSITHASYAWTSFNTHEPAGDANNLPATPIKFACHANESTGNTDPFARNTNRVCRLLHLYNTGS